MATSLLSVGFLWLIVAAVVSLSILRGARRQLAFLTLNLIFVVGMVLGVVGAASTILFAVLGYVLVQLAMRGGRAALALGLTFYVVLFVYMRRYDALEWVLPQSMLTSALSTIGLSFLFFKIVHVMVDAYSGTLGRLDFLTYLNYCLNFTTFLMGPIQRYQDYREQWNGEKEAIPLTFEAHLDAVIRILFGFIKIYIVAAFLAGKALQPETNLLDLTLLGFIVQIYAFWLYLYFNFSGYCDVVIGVGSLFGVRPPENFNRPYLARNISDFWLRQHRSLTLWLTDYVFTPLYKKLLRTKVTARYKIAAAYLCLMVTMMVSGLWHGTTMSFFLFGLVHGLWFVIYRAWDNALTARLGKAGVHRFRRHPLVHAGGVVLTFNATALAFVFFQVRSDRIADALGQLWR
ncbi:MAG TPA: MBOAT family O-acyltransferase [Gemmatimonadaceae bacterium]|nr:MBOAT family O-acyltransferase [Gemmatimonadaceae bacterium]